MNVSPLNSSTIASFVAQAENQLIPDVMDVASFLRLDLSQPQVLAGRSIIHLASDIDFTLVEDMLAHLSEDRPFYISHSPKYCGESPTAEDVFAEDFSHDSVESMAQLGIAFQRGWLKDIILALYKGSTEILEMSLPILIGSYPFLIAEGGTLRQIIKALQSLSVSGCKAHKLEAEQLLTVPLIGGTLTEWGTEQSPLINASAASEETEILSESLIMILLECLRFSVTLLRELVFLDATSQDILGTGIAPDFRRTYYV